MNPYLKQYQKTQVETSSPEIILIMLYDGAILFLNRAKMAFERNDLAEIHENLIGCQKIIAEFMSTLDMEIGGELAKNLYMLYDYLYERLVEANVKKDISYVDEVLEHLKSLKATWEEAIRRSQKEMSAIKTNTVLNSNDEETDDTDYDAYEKVEEEEDEEEDDDE